MFGESIAARAPYAEWAPPAALSLAVECVWTRGRSPSACERERLVVPDNCADILLEFDDDGELVSSSVVGAMSRPLIASSTERAIAGVRFRPGWLASSLGVDAGEIRDRRVPLGDLSMPLAASLGQGLSLTDAVHVLVRNATDWAQPSACATAAIQALLSSRGALRIDGLARDLGVSRQWLARCFTAEVGVSPKTFARVARVQHARRAGARGESWVQVAARLGFADQSHLINEMRQLTGETPTSRTPLSISAGRRPGTTPDSSSTPGRMWAIQL